MAVKEKKVAMMIVDKKKVVENNKVKYKEVKYKFAGVNPEITNEDLKTIGDEIKDYMKLEKFSTVRKVTEEEL